MAVHMAQLLADSDAEELAEVVRRWVAEAPDDRARAAFSAFGAKLLELQRALAAQGHHPSREDLEVALSMMLDLAASRPSR
jgi:hypothetical protein